MNARFLSSLPDLVGLWSCLVFLVGLIAAAFYHFCSAPHARISATLAMAMLLVSLLMVLFVVPASMAYSGPIASEERDLWLFDKYLAALIAFVFAALFGCEWLRVRSATT